MSGALVAHCPAKINLALHVLRKRDDGYHELDTVFQAVDLWDRLEIRPASDWSLSCDTPGVPVDRRNLVVRAGERLAESAGMRPRGAMTLVKAIPALGGLGGGSSDAAAALLLCARFWRLDPSRPALAELAAGLGADVPFFLVGGTARGTGRGDRITPLEPLPETPLLLGFPPFGVPTAEVFGRLAGRLTLPGNGVSLAPRFAYKWRSDKDFALAKNDLETVVFEGWPELEDFRDALVDAGAVRAMLSGSGSTVFGAFSDTGTLTDAAEGLARRFPRWGFRRTRTTGGGIRIEPAP